MEITQSAGRLIFSALRFKVECGLDCAGIAFLDDNDFVLVWEHDRPAVRTEKLLRSRADVVAMFGSRADDDGSIMLRLRLFDVERPEWRHCVERFLHEFGR